MALVYVAPDEDLVRELLAARQQPRGIAAAIENRAPEERTDVLRAIALRADHIAASEGVLTHRDLERMLGRNDLVRLNYLERGLLAARAVCRISVTDAAGGGESGTGFLVGPQLLLTNNHVVGSPDAARQTTLEFGYERDAAGQFRTPRRFACAPELGFVTDVALDYTLVVVRDRAEDGATDLAEYGFLRLDPRIHKVEESNFVTIIQHPGGDEKYVALRENRVIKIGDAANRAPLRANFLWYYSDTAPGSSGAPVFNDSWQVVALHHRGVPESRVRDGITEWQLSDGEWAAAADAQLVPDDRITWIANEGVRISSIIEGVQAQVRGAGAAASPLIQALLDDASGVRPFANVPDRAAIVGPPLRTGASPSSAPVSVPSLERRDSAPKLGQLDYYAECTGYDRDFLGQRIRLPDLTAAIPRFGPRADVAGSADDVLHYTHFSVVMNRTRRLAYFTAVNIDGTVWQGEELTRGSDSWYFDPRLERALQTGPDLYGSEPDRFGVKGWFDRGHLVRREDPVWGTLTTAKRANNETFHWTNCSPQYWGFNQGAAFWQGLENFILNNTDDEDVRATVFTGPVFDAADEVHRGVQIPRAFWKVVVVRDSTNALYSSAYTVSQAQYAQNIPFERLPIGSVGLRAVKQITVAALEMLTGLRFARVVREADVFRPASGEHERAVRGLRDLLPNRIR